MPLGAKPACSSCKTSYSSMWKKGEGNEVLCNSCFVKQNGTNGGKESNEQNSNSSTNNKTDGNGLGPVLRKSTRLKPSRNRFQPTNKPVATKGKSRRIIFKKSLKCRSMPGGRYREYSHADITNAYFAVKEGAMLVTKAAQIYGVPPQTLRDRVSGRIGVDCVTSGTYPAFAADEEAKIAEYLKNVAKSGYGFSRKDIVDIASDYAIQLGKRPKTKPLTLNWFRKFIVRWPELRNLYLRPLKQKRAKSIPNAEVSTYFDKLEDDLKNYGLKSKPHLIFNIDEMRITQKTSHPYIVAKTDYCPEADDISSITTVIGCGNACGMALPPFLVYKGTKMLPDLLNEISPGVSGKLSETGISNCGIFRHYLQNHFLKFIPRRTPDEHLLLLLDGHKTHASVGFFEWAKENNIVISFVPAYTSHILQPLDFGCYKFFQKKCDSEYRKLMGTTFKTITRYNICELACRVYSKTMSGKHLHSAFRKTGLYPFKRVFVSGSVKQEDFLKEKSDMEGQQPIAGCTEALVAVSSEEESDIEEASQMGSDVKQQDAIGAQHDIDMDEQQRNIQQQIALIMQQGIAVVMQQDIHGVQQDIDIGAQIVIGSQQEIVMEEVMEHGSCF